MKRITWKWRQAHDDAERETVWTGTATRAGCRVGTFTIWRHDGGDTYRTFDAGGPPVLPRTFATLRAAQIAITEHLREAG